VTNYLFHPRDLGSVAMKVNWPVVRKVTMVVRFFKVNSVFSGLVQSLSEFLWIAQNWLGGG
jgi:hypothetical protein